MFLILEQIEYIIKSKEYQSFFWSAFWKSVGFATVHCPHCEDTHIEALNQRRKELVDFVIKDLLDAEVLIVYFGRLEFLSHSVVVIYDRQRLSHHFHVLPLVIGVGLYSDHAVYILSLGNWHSFMITYNLYNVTSNTLIIDSTPD